MNLLFILTYNWVSARSLSFTLNSFYRSIRSIDKPICPDSTIKSASACLSLRSNSTFSSSTLWIWSSKFFSSYISNMSRYLSLVLLFSISRVLSFIVLKNKSSNSLAPVSSLSICFYVFWISTFYLRILSGISNNSKASASSSLRGRIFLVCFPIFFNEPNKLSKRLFGWGKNSWWSSWKTFEYYTLPLVFNAISG